MGFLSDIREAVTDTPTWKIAVFVSICIGTVGAGFLIIFYFKPMLVEKYDMSKLLMLSMGLSVPLALLNLYGFILWAERKQHEGTGLTGNECFSYIFFLAMLMNTTAIYLPLLICYLFGLKFKWFLGMALIISCAVLVDEIIAKWKNSFGSEPP